MQIQSAKRALRKHIKQVLLALPQDAIATQSSHAVQTLLRLPEYQASKRIGIYLAMPEGEISTASIVHDALAQGKKVFIPYTYRRSVQPELKPKSIMDMVELHSTKDLENMQPDKWNIPTPGADSIKERKNCFGGLGLSEGDTDAISGVEAGLDLIVMPGMAFDADFGRLGHGKGFYDFFLDRCVQHSEKAPGVRMPFIVGLALKEQILLPAQSIPMDSTDWRLDALVVGDGEILRSNKPQPPTTMP